MEIDGMLSIIVSHSCMEIINERVKIPIIKQTDHHQWLAGTDVLMCNDHRLPLLQPAHRAQAPVASAAPGGACCPLALAVAMRTQHGAEACLCRKVSIHSFQD
eukprot:6211052-Pleurochrysis_carterae.AAC.1